jgi:hypothetical protein
LPIEITWLSPKRPVPLSAMQAEPECAAIETPPRGASADSGAL